MKRLTPESSRRKQGLGDLSAPALSLLEELPVLGSMVKAYGIGRSISDRMFLRKVKRFTEGFEEVGSPAAEELAKKIYEDEGFSERAAEAVLLSIDAITDLEKAPVLAYIYAAYLRDQIDFDTFRRLLAAVNQSIVDDLWTLTAEEPANGKWEENAHQTRWMAIEALRTTGITALSRDSFALVNKRSFATTEITSLGRTLIVILRDAEARRTAKENGWGSKAHSQAD
ncbi:MAG TPA: hypothetical protein VLK84_24055 [Longimicrobium sp.]|nr:hypothetical protein [Longimicrobium sp.]